MSNYPLGFGRLGGIIFSNVILDGLSPTGGLTINECLVGISNTKNVVTTPISGRNGTIKEYINRGDYRITVSGLLVNEIDNFFPTAKVRKFINICEKEEPISFSNAFANHYNITSVVVLDYKLSEKQATRNGVPFSLTLLSDTPIEIKVNA